MSMTMTLDHLATQAIAKARLLERAVHEPEGWSVVVGDQAVSAERVALPSAVQFTAWLEPTEDCTAMLCHNGEILSVRGCEPQTETWGLQWVIEASAPVATR